MKEPGKPIFLRLTDMIMQALNIKTKVRFVDSIRFTGKSLEIYILSFLITFDIY